MPREANAWFKMTAEDEQPAGAVSARQVSAEPSAEPIEAPPEPAPTPPTTRTPEWIAQARRLDLLEVAEDLGVDVVPTDDGNGLLIRPCPV